jgi:hypothetical protein
MQVKVYAESLNHTAAELWAVFQTEEMYDVCADALDKLAAESRMIIVTSVEESDE